MIYVINYKLNQLDFSTNIGYRLDNKVIAYKTEKTSAYWVKRFIYFNNKTYPKNLGIVIDDLSFSPAKAPRRLPYTDFAGAKTYPRSNSAVGVICEPGRFEPRNPAVPAVK